MDLKNRAATPKLHKCDFNITALKSGLIKFPRRAKQNSTAGTTKANKPACRRHVLYFGKII